jgi:type VI secretion system secreted protein VgrG
MARYISSEGHVSIASGSGWFATVRHAWRVLVLKAGMKLVAAAGDILIEALKHSIHLRSPKEVTLKAEVIRIEASQQLIVNGGGSYVRLEAGRVEQAAAGRWVAHGLEEVRDQPVEIEDKGICVECLMKASQGGAVVMPR